MIDPETADAIATGPMQLGPPLECDLDDEGTPILGRDAALYAELGRGIEVWLRARASMQRHHDAYLAGKTDEDHAAGVYFNMNLAEYVRLFFTEEEEMQARAVERLQSEELGKREAEAVPETCAPVTDEMVEAARRDCCGGSCDESFRAPFTGTPVDRHD